MTNEYFFFNYLAISDPRARVSVGGRPANIGEVPYQASIRSTLTQTHLCSGAILNTRWILTHADCTFQRLPSSVSSVVGSLLWNAGIVHPTAQVITHPGFNVAVFLNE